MANKRKLQLADATPETPPTATIPDSLPGSQTLDHETPAGYEQLRQQRIKENLQRMQNLGIADLSLKLKTSVAAKRAPRIFSSERKTPIRLVATGPSRRSSRLQSVAPVSYVENVKLTKQEEKKMDRSIYLEEGAKPEVYTEEHEKLLGSTELEWTFFVDGYGPDGKRIYDSVNGKTCHQCRQKTLGHRTHCSNCQIVQGQFCGDCLMMRYGEHVLEAKKNPDWICPPCRGICNCSLCRQGKGWAPTGAMYKKIANLGYKSVAHYLIQTMRAPPPATESDEIISKTPHSAKRSLAFTGMEPQDDLTHTKKKVISGQKLDYGETENDDCKENDASVLNAGNSEVKDCPEMLIAENEDQMEDKTPPDCKKNDVSVLNAGKSEVKDCHEMLKAENEGQMENKTTPNHAKKTRYSIEPKMDSVARRTRSRCNGKLLYASL